MSTTTASGKIKYKLVFLGNQNVGKSSIIEKYIHNRFDEASNPTVGIDFLAKNTVYQGKTFRLQLWDTAGQERFKSLIPSYLKDAIGAIIVYDVTNKQSLADAEKWLKLYTDNKSIEGHTVLVANKIDIPYREISTEEGQKVAKELKITHYEMSAKTGENVEELFYHIIDALLQSKAPHAETTMGKIKQQRKEEQAQNDTTVKQLNKPTKPFVVLPPASNNIVLNTTVAPQQRSTSQACC